MRPFLVIAALCAVSLAGCGKFFIKVVPGPAPGNSGSNLYVANPLSPTATVAGFAIGTSALTALTSSPYAGGLGASCVALAPNNKFFYEGTVSNGIFLYTVNTNGSLTLGNTSLAVATGISASAMNVDPTGGWLIVTDQLNQQVLSYAIDPNTGLLTSTVANIAALHAGAPNHIVITPNKQLVFVSLGTGGVDIFTFDVTSGALARAGNLPPRTAQSADQGLATDLNGVYLFVAETGNAANKGLRQLTIGTNGALTESAGSPYFTGLGPAAVLVDATGSYVYVANRTDGTITAYALPATGLMTAIAGSPYAAGTNPVDMVEDNTKTYIAVVNNGGNADLQLFKFDTTTAGKLNLAASAATGTDPTNPIAVVATH